ncbi:hypothetical protein H3V53_28865 [Paraburkholderia bengalensis]|uniref:Uncharacterized protein n=1 Tax=Paraburkholderia bengalensis TaxID=2747562 RepID=A0ABU8IZJ1_9BURK
MALSNSERQRRYRKRKLGAGGRYERLSCFVSITTKRNVERLSDYFGCTMTQMVERLINEKTESLLRKLNEEERQRFYVHLKVVDG